MSQPKGPEILRWAESFARRTALREGARSLTYRDLLAASSAMAARLLQERRHLEGQRVGVLVASGLDYVVTQWATWMAGGVAVPLAVSHPVPEIRYVLEDAGVKTLVIDQGLWSKGCEAARDLEVRILSAESTQEVDVILEPVESSDALILYTSGTTGRPKGVVLSHSNLQAQVTSLIEAWDWRPEDRILNVLPLHHVHGIVNVTMCALWSGACCEMLAPFDAGSVWQRLSSGDLTLFMAVPTIYSRLVRYWEDQDASLQRRLSEGASRLRLMVSGSAALPVPVLEEWQRISGHTLLERYGMTEIGMALSNPLQGERRPGMVGLPLPGVEVRLVSEEGQEIEETGTSGEIEVRGPSVFRAYWRRVDETQAAFRGDWFRTGDVAEQDDNGSYRILGRNSVDIIKTGGYKVSALEIEGVLLSHSNILECAVVGVEDQDWGECVCAAVVCSPGETLQLADLRQWAKRRLAVYKVPSRLKLCSELPRNAMGKVTKPQVRDEFSRKNKDS